MTGLIGSNYMRADKVPDHVINYNPEPGEYSGMGSDAMLDLKARALIRHARSLGNEDIDSVKRYIDSLDTPGDPGAMEIQKRASSYFDRRRMSYEDQVTLDTLLSGGDFLDALATSLGATREETAEYLGEINSRRTGEPGQMAKVRDSGYVADLALAKNAAGIYSDWKNPVRRYGRRRQDSAQKEFHSRSHSVTPGALGFLMDPAAAAEELLWHPANLAELTPEESRLQLSKDRASSAPGGYEAFSPDEFARALSSVKHSLIRGLRKQDPSLTLIQAERLSNGLMIPMLEERSEFIRSPLGVPGRKAKRRSIEKRFPLDRESPEQLAEVLRIYDGERNGTFEKIQKKDERLADMWREAVKAVKQRFESSVYPEQIASVSHRAVTARADAKGGNAPGVSKSSGVPSGHNPALDGYSGPRVVINPTTFKNEKDGLCVSFNEAFRILMAVNGFDPVAEPTEKQREFFSDTAYANDELQMRRTILARICTFDTSVTDPTDEQLQEAVEFLDTVLEIGAPQNQWEQRAVERIRTAISQALESGERVPTSQAPAPEDSPEIAAGGAGSSAGGVPEDEEKDHGAEFRENAQAQMDEAAKLAQEGPTTEEQKMQAMAEATGRAAGDDPLGKSAEMNAAAQEAGLKADIAEAQKPENLMQKNGHYVDAQGRVISERAARALAEQNVRNAAAQDTNNQQQAPAAGTGMAQNSPQTASERIGTTSGIKGLGGRELTAGEAAWQARKQASTAAWMQRTGRSSDGVADALAQRDEWANNLRQNSQVDSGRRDLLGRRLDDRGRVIV